MSRFVAEIEHANVVRGGRAILHDLSLTIAQGEQVAVLGPNGCGKSTLLKTLTCELYPLAEPRTHVKMFGRERWDVAELKKHLGVVQNELPGKPILKLNGLDAVLTGFFSSSALWPNLEVTFTMREKAEAVLHRIEADTIKERIFSEMSSGQQRRILIARALVASAECLLLDEPSNALDLRAQKDFLQLLSTLSRAGTTIILITHQVADIIPEIRRVLMIKDGRIFADGRREDLLTEAALSSLFKTQVRLIEHDGVYHAT